jgi:hypothetical protein
MPQELAVAGLQLLVFGRLVRHTARQKGR